MTFKYPSSDRNIDDKIVSEALGNERVVIDAVESPSEPKPKMSSKGKGKTRKALSILGVGAALLAGVGVFVSNEKAPNLSPELAHLIASGKGAEQQPEAAPAPATTGGEEIAPMAAKEVLPETAAGGSPEMASPMPLGAEPEKEKGQVVVAAAPQAAAPTQAAVAVTPAPVEAAARVANTQEQDLLLSLKEEVASLKKTVAGLEKDKSDLKNQVAALQKGPVKPVAVVAKPAPKPVQKPKPAAKPAVEPVKKVMAILSDGIVLHDGDVIDVGTASPKVGGKLTGVSPSTGTIEVNGEARHVVVDPN